VQIISKRYAALEARGLVLKHFADLLGLDEIIDTLSLGMTFPDYHNNTGNREVDTDIQKNVPRVFG
jgi:hypothetical protein